MTRTGVFAGTFDPVHYGHMFIMDRALQFLDHLHVIVANNSEKKTWFTFEQRMDLVKECCRNLHSLDRDRISFHILESGLLVKQAHKLGAQHLIRGVRNLKDCEYELNISDVNFTQEPGIITILLPTPHDISFVSSSAVRELLIHKGDLTKYLPPNVLAKIPK